jgi:hypothetical protein
LLVKRRLPVALHDSPLDRRTRLVLIGGLALLQILSELNSLPSQLSSYDTAQPWSTFLGTTALGFIGPVVVALMSVGLLLALDKLRRRVGIPMLAGEPSSSALRDMLIAGLGLGGIMYALVGLEALLPDVLPSVPSTALDDAVPLLSGIPNIPMNAIVMIAVTGIPILVIAGLTPRWRSRALIGAGVVVLAIAIAWSFRPTAAADPLGVAIAIVSIVLMLVAISVWGGWSAWSWIVAALSYQALAAVRTVVYGAEWHERAAGALTVLVSIGLVALILRYVIRSRELRAGSQPMSS